jgi:hypothetical protein
VRHTHSFHSLILCALAVIALCAAQTFAQTTVIAYQGKLDFGGVPANGNYDFQFRLFDDVSGGAQQGSQEEQLNVTVTNGTYTVNLDFGATPFISSSGDRFLEVSFRATGSSTYSTLTPRQLVTTTPYSIHSLVANTAHGLDATCTSCVTSSQIQNVQGSQVTGNLAGSQISGTIPVTSVPAGSGNYIQNTTSPQPSSNFNIGGSGIVGGLLSGNIVNATTQYSIGTSRVLGYDGSNLSVGFNAGNANTTGIFNLSVGSSAGNANTTGSENNFFGFQAGHGNTTGAHNSFFGYTAGCNNTTGGTNSFFGNASGYSNTTGGGNAFFGESAGMSNTSGFNNAFFGSDAGFNNQTGANNSFFGRNAGMSNTTGIQNAFFGVDAGLGNTTGNFNASFGRFAGLGNTTGDSNAFFGDRADADSSNLHNATAIGANAQVSQNNSLVLGGINGINGATADTKVGIGTTAPADRLHVAGIIRVSALGAAGTTQLCRNASNQISFCSSSLRYKTDLRPFAGGMSIINRLQPISFTWKDGGMRDMGFGAEDVQKIEPLLVTYNAQGLVEGVKYDRVTVVLVNALKEHQQQIASQQAQIEGLKSIQAENDKLKAQLADILARLEQMERAQASRK